mmetsp:Transcript_39169/g.53188  ORF Transcript_39169/g.53188 Transcript_39169/m.53188 type:complete len:230 (-) Transcript_39169:8-697(-)
MHSVLCSVLGSSSLDVNIRDLGEFRIFFLILSLSLIIFIFLILVFIFVIRLESIIDLVINTLLGGLILGALNKSELIIRLESIIDLVLNTFFGSFILRALNLSKNLFFFLGVLGFFFRFFVIFRFLVVFGDLIIFVITAEELTDLLHGLINLFLNESSSLINILLMLFDLSLKLDLSNVGLLNPVGKVKVLLRNLFSGLLELDGSDNSKKCNVNRFHSDVYVFLVQKIL